MSAFEERSLFVMRHAKSAWGEVGLGDHERPLTKRGRKAADLMGEFLAQTGQAPEHVLASSAVRARTTAERAEKAGAWGASLEVTDQLYDARVTDVLDLLHGVPARVTRLLVAGHEPTSSELVGRLVGGAQLRFPTAAMARVDFHGDSWQDLVPGAGTLRWLMVPRLLGPWMGVEAS